MKNIGIDELQNVMRRLRAPDGCPWDREQTHKSLKKCLIGEAAEYLDAVDASDDAGMREELGDLMFTIVNLTRFRGGTDASETLQRATDKFVRRFQFVEQELARSGRAVSDAGPEELDRLWNQAKSQEKRS